MIKKIFILISVILNIIFISKGYLSSLDIFFKNNDKIEKTYSVTDNGQKVYTETEFNSNNEAIYKRIVVDSEIVKESYYYIDGNVKEECNYKNGKKHGLWATYHQDGRIREDGRYENGELKEVATYYDNGSIKELSYPETEIIRLITTYFPNGNVESQGKKILSKNGNEAFYGRWLWYNIDGTLKDEMVFDSDL